MGVRTGYFLLNLCPETWMLRVVKGMEGSERLKKKNIRLSCKFTV